MATYLQCGCGVRLKAPGARPGRVGICPACGARVVASARTIVVERDAPTVPNATSTADVPVEDENIASRPLGRGRKKKRPKKRHAAGEAGIEPVGRGGLIPLPGGPQRGLAASWGYPVWDGAGVMWLLLIPLPLWITTVIVFWVIPGIIRGNQLLFLLGPVLFGFIVMWALVLGYMILIWEAVVTSTAQGDMHHPPWPEVEFYAIAHGLVRWLAAFAPGLIGVWVYLGMRGVGDAGGVALLCGIAALGIAYGLIGTVASGLHQDPLAASPLVVLPALGRLNGGYALVWLLATMVAVGEGLVLYFLSQLQNVWTAILVAFVNSYFIIYLWIVIARMLGVVYCKSAKRLGWFRTKRRQVMPEIRTPTGA